MLETIKTTLKRNGLLLLLFSVALLYIIINNSIENTNSLAQYEKLELQIITCNHRYDSLSQAYSQLREDNMYCSLKMDAQNEKIEQLYKLIIRLNNTCDMEERKRITRKEFPLLFAEYSKHNKNKALL
jgi:predicted  nucleic acid-binding Zn-ribbon protein